MMKTGILATLVVVLSFVLGFARDLSIAAIFGTAAEADFIFLALLIPAVVETIFGISIRDALIPYVDAAQRRCRLTAFSVAARIGWPLLTGSILFAAILVIWPHTFVHLLVPGWGATLVNAAVPPFQIGAMVVVLSIWAYFLSALLHLRGKFVLPLWRSVFLNLGAISALWMLGSSATMVLWCIALSLTLHLIWLQFSLGSDGVMPLRPPRGPVRFSKFFIPLLVATLATQVNVLGERFFASWLEVGTISQLSYAFRIATIPLSIFTLSVLSIVYTRRTQTVGRSDSDEVRTQTALGLSLTFFLMVPSSVYLACWAEDVVRILLYRGEFTKVDVIETAAMLQAYCIGVFFMALGLLLSRFALSAGKTWPILISGVASVAATLVLDYVLVSILGGQGLAVAMSVGAVLNSVMLLALMRIDTPTLVCSFKVWFSCGIVIYLILDLWPLQSDAGVVLSAIPVALVSLSAGYLDPPLRTEISNLVRSGRS